jgi:hypothetical protein
VFEDEIVAEEEAVAGPGGPRSPPSRGATVTSTSTSMFSVTFTSIPSLSLLRLTWLSRISSVRLELGMLRAHGVSQSDHKKIARGFLYGCQSAVRRPPTGTALPRDRVSELEADELLYNDDPEADRQLGRAIGDLCPVRPVP